MQKSAPEASIAGRIGFTSAAMLIMGSMIGSGIFKVSAGMAGSLHRADTLLLNWALAGFITILAALSYGELAAMMPRAGGQYVYLRRCYSPLTGFLFGWSTFGVIQTGTIAAVAVVFAEYAALLIPGMDGMVLFYIGPYALTATKILALSVIWLLTVTNFAPVERGALVQNLFTTIKLLSLLALIAAALIFGPGGAGNVSHFSADAGIISGSPVSFTVFMAALTGSLFSMDAWNNITYTAGEIKQPQRNIPRALITGTGIVILLYLLINVAYIYILPMSEIAASPDGRVAAHFMKALMGQSGVVIITIFVLISTFGCLNGIILSGARVYYAMAREGAFLPAAGKLNKSAVPANSLMMQGAWAGVLALSGSYDQLLNYIMFVVIAFYALTIGGLFILRLREPGEARPYRALGYPVLPALYILLATAFCISLFMNNTQDVLYGVGIVLLGIPVFYLLKMRAAPAGQK